MVCGWTMKNFSIQQRSRRNDEKRVSDSSEEQKSLQNYPEDLMKRGAELLVSKTLPSERWKSFYSSLRAKHHKSKCKDIKTSQNKLKPVITDLEVVNEVLFFDKRISQDSKYNKKNFQNSLEKEKEISSKMEHELEKTPANRIRNDPTEHHSVKQIKSVNPINNLNKFIQEKKLLSNNIRRPDCRETDKKSSNVLPNKEGNIVSIIEVKTKLPETQEAESTIKEDINLKKGAEYISDQEDHNDVTESSKELKKVKTVDPGLVEEYNSSKDPVEELSPEHRAIYEAAVTITDLITNKPKSLFSRIFKKIFNMLHMKEQKTSEELMMEPLKKLAQTIASEKEAPEVVPNKTTQMRMPMHPRKEALLAKFTSQPKPQKKIVVAEMTTNIAINSYKEAKEVLATIFEVPYNDFAGITRMPDPKKHSFLIEEAALLKYSSKLPNPSAGHVRPWNINDLSKGRSILTIICNKIAENSPRNKGIKNDARCLLKILNDGDYPPDCFIMEQNMIDRHFPVRKL